MIPALAIFIAGRIPFEIIPVFFCHGIPQFVCSSSADILLTVLKPIAFSVFATEFNEFLCGLIIFICLSNLIYGKIILGGIFFGINILVDLTMHIHQKHKGQFDSSVHYVCIQIARTKWYQSSQTVGHADSFQHDFRIILGAQTAQVKHSIHHCTSQLSDSATIIQAAIEFVEVVLLGVAEVVFHILRTNKVAKSFNPCILFVKCYVGLEIVGGRVPDRVIIRFPHVCLALEEHIKYFFATIFFKDHGLEHGNLHSLPN